MNFIKCYSFTTTCPSIGLFQKKKRVKSKTFKYEKKKKNENKMEKKVSFDLNKNQTSSI